MVRFICAVWRIFLGSCKDQKGEVCPVALCLEEGARPPAGLTLGAIMRIKDPRIHYFRDGTPGLYIGDHDWGRVAISDS